MDVIRHTGGMRRLAAIMFTDIVGYTAMMQRNEQQAASLRRRHRTVFETEHQRYHGEIIQYFGDGTLSIFRSSVEAVACAFAMQKAFRQEPQVPLRIGIHLGDIVYEQTEIYGDGVNVASRIESMAVAGSVLISSRIQNELQNQPDFSTTSLGTFDFKNVRQPLEIFALTNTGLSVPDQLPASARTSLPDRSIAVLPFLNLSGDPAQEYLSDGMTEEIINALTRIQHLKVTSRTSSFYFKDRQLPLRKIGESLGVSTILEGSIRLAGKRMRLTAQLIDVVDDTHFWSETFERSLDDIFAVQDEISLLIAERLREHLGHLEIEEHLVDQPSVPVEIYQRYLHSRHLMLKMGFEDLEQALQILEEIVRDFPNYALAYLGIHQAYTLLATLGMMSAGDAFGKAHIYLQNAIKLEPDLPECQLNLAWISFLQDWDPPGAYAHLRKSHDIRPGVEYYQSMASILVAEQKCSAADQYLSTAEELDPFSTINCHLRGFVRYVEEDYDAAIDYFDQGIQLNADSQVSQLYWGQALVLKGDPQSGYDYFKQLPADQDEVRRQGGMGIALAAMGKHKEAKEKLQLLEDQMYSDHMERALNLRILISALIDDSDSVFELIDQAVALRLPMLVYLPCEPMLKHLRSDQRFLQLRRTILGEHVEENEARERKYKQSLLDDDTLEHYQQKLTKLMEEEAPYLDPTLTLKDLASRMKIPPNQLSQLLNEGFHQNFAAFINTYRLRDFKVKVSDPMNQHLTLLGLAYESGFGSKTVFNTFFKKAMGQTPKAYLRQIQEQ